MGNPYGVVKTGTFKYTSMLPYCRNVTNTEFVARTVGPQNGRFLIRNADIEKFLAMDTFTVSCLGSYHIIYLETKRNLLQHKLII